MSGLNDYFGGEKTADMSYPLIRLLDAQKSRPDFFAAKVEIIRPRASLGFEPAQLSLQFYGSENAIYDYKTEPWDAELNAALVEREIRAVDEANEIRRFGLALATAFKRPESRYGDGFFSSVLMLVVDESPFGESSPVRKMRQHISTGRPYQHGHSANDCGELIQGILQDRWIELTKQLHYEKSDAERILVGALAYYLDDRFSITDGEKLGWLKAY